jgi:hypothetical protein
MGLYGDADLVVTADVGYTRTLVYQINSVAVDWTLYTIKSSVRDRYNALLFDLTPFMTVNSADHTQLLINIGAAYVYALPREAKWDLLATLKTDATVVFRTPTPAGRVLLLPGVTSRV